MYDSRLTIGWKLMVEPPSHWVPLAALGAPEEAESPTDLPLAYLPRIPDGRTFRDMIERGVAWGRR